MDGRCILATVLLAACASGAGNFPEAASVRPATGLPGRFEPVVAERRLQPGDTLAGGGCLSPLVDPRDGTRLTLARSIAPYGDYDASPARYGVGAATLLRVECNTGRGVGLVPR